MAKNTRKTPKVSTAEIVEKQEIVLTPEQLEKAQEILKEKEEKKKLARAENKKRKQEINQELLEIYNQNKILRAKRKSLLTEYNQLTALEKTI